MVFKFIGHDPLYVTGGLYELESFATNEDGIYVWIKECGKPFVIGNRHRREMLYGSLEAFEKNWEKY